VRRRLGVCRLEREGLTLGQKVLFGGSDDPGLSPAPVQRGREEIADYALSWAERYVVSLAEHGD
jgi:hypothetical protein